MYKPLAMYIGLRYTRAKRGSQFISFISLISMLGIALGVTVLITVLSVLNGFDREIKKQIFDMITPITITSYSGQINHWQELEKTLKKFPDITASAPFINGQGLITNADMTQPVMITGIAPDKEKHISALADKMIEGQLNDLKPNHFGIILGEDLANHLKAKVGDSVIVAAQRGGFSTDKIAPQFKKFVVTGIFRAGGGGFSFDSKLAFIDLSDAQQLFGLNSVVTGMRANVSELYSAPMIADQLREHLSPDIRVWNWTDMLGDYFENIRMTKTMMFFIFILIIAVAVFNLISTMVMVVKNKHSDIAILRTFGATPKMILAIFIVQGAAIGIGGTLLGILGGITLALNIPGISVWIQHAFNVQLVSSSIYFVDYLPSILQWSDVWMISGIALALSLFATIYPAWNASRLDPVEALRSDV